MANGRAAAWHQKRMIISSSSTWPVLAYQQHHLTLQPCIKENGKISYGFARGPKSLTGNSRSRHVIVCARAAAAQALRELAFARSMLYGSNALSHAEI